MGDLEAGALVSVESQVEYHSFHSRILTGGHESGHRTVSGGQFDWGGRLLKGNGGAQRFPQHGRKSCIECKGTRELHCETNKSSRDESRA